jgi:hypothetical protein
MFKVFRLGYHQDKEKNMPSSERDICRFPDGEAIAPTDFPDGEA